MERERRKLFSVFDTIIILVVVISSVLALVLQFGSNNDLTCVVRTSSETVYTVKLSDNIDETYVVDGEFPVTVVVDKDGVYVRSASCPDKLCEHTGKITRSGQSIVCLPAKVTVTLESSSDEFDAVVG